MWSVVQWVTLLLGYTAGLLGRYSQPNGGLLGLAAGLMAVLATAGLVDQVGWGSSMGPGASLAWAAAGALSTWLLWRHQVCYYSALGLDCCTNAQPTNVHPCCERQLRCS